MRTETAQLQLPLPDWLGVQLAMVVPPWPLSRQRRAALRLQIMTAAVPRGTSNRTGAGTWPRPAPIDKSWRDE